jgi:EREBP-like factor
MAEWKTVDKEIWLRIFETEEVAARALDVARKLLRCKKK